MMKISVQSLYAAFNEFWITFKFQTRSLYVARKVNHAFRL